MTGIQITPKWREVKPSGFYVYAHRKADIGEIFYIGKGRGKRAWCGRRNAKWKEVADRCGAVIEICQDGLSEADAMLLEEWLIDKFRHEGKWLANIARGGVGYASGVPTHKNAINAMIRSVAKPVYCSNGMHFNSCSDAARWASGGSAKSCANITQCAMGRSVAAYGHAWSYDYFPPSPKSRYERTSETNGSPVINSEGAIFKTPRDAAKWLNKNGGNASINFISRAARANRTAYGYTWSRDVSKAPIHVDPNYTNVAGQMRKVSNDSGNVFESISSAVRFLIEVGHPKARSSGIHAALNGKAKTAYGYKWKYVVDT